LIEQKKHQRIQNKKQREKEAAVKKAATQDAREAK
jgi:hypothetical protein